MPLLFLFKLTLIPQLVKCFVKFYEIHSAYVFSIIKLKNNLFLMCNDCFILQTTEIIV